MEASLKRGSSEPIPLQVNTSDIAAALANEYKFGIQRKQKEANPNYEYQVKGMMKNGDHTEWESKFDRPLEYFLFPSLQLLPQDIQDREIIKEKEKEKNVRKIGSYGENSPKSMHGHRGSPKAGGRSPSPGRRKKHTHRDGSGSPKGRRQHGHDHGHHDNPYDYDSDRSENALEEEEVEPDFSRPNVYWDLKTKPADAKLPDDAKVIKEREFMARLNQGEIFNRRNIQKEYEEFLFKEIEKNENERRMKMTINSKLHGKVKEKENMA